MPERSEKHLEAIPTSLTEPWPELPSNYKTVLHYADRDAIALIARNGIRHFSERTAESERSDAQQKLLEFDALCDKVAEEVGFDFKRSQATFFALADNASDAGWERFGDARLEVKVDADKAYVFDRQLHSLGAIAFYKTPDGKELLEVDYPKGTADREKIEQMLAEEISEDWQLYIEEYFKRARTLTEYNALSDEEKRIYKRPEVAVSGSIEPGFIRMSQN